MGLTERLQKGFAGLLNKEMHAMHEQIVAYNPTYEKAKEFVKVWGSEALKRMKAQLGDNGRLGYDAIVATAEMKKKEFAQHNLGKSLEIEVLIDPANGELYVPVKAEIRKKPEKSLFAILRHEVLGQKTQLLMTRTALERDVLEHLLSAVRSHQMSIETTGMAGFCIIRYDVKQGGFNAAAIASLPEAMALSNVSVKADSLGLFSVQQCIRPSGINLNVTDSYIKHGLIILHNNDRKFFPAYGQRFTINVVGHGDLTAYVTSRSRDATPTQGNYVYGADRQLQHAFKSIGLKVGDMIRIEETEHHRRYELRKV